MCSCNDMPDLGANDYSLQTANVGIATISTANPALTGANATAVFTAASSPSSGAIIKSVRIKAIQPVTTGMIRLFVSNSGATAMSLYKEVPVPVTPELAATPTPQPVLPTFEIMLQGGLKIPAGFKLYAATQNAQSFNIITEGLDWKYPGTLPGTCCNFKQQTAVIGLGTISTANLSLSGSGTIGTIYTAPGSINGSFIKTITIKALQTTAINGMVRLFISPDGSTWTLFQEIMVPETNQSGFEPSFKMVVDLNMNINTGYYLGASTQLAESFAITVEALDWTYPIS